MPYAIQFDRPGGAEALQWRKTEMPKPGKGEVLLRQTAIGVNFIDIYHRTGLYALPDYPATPGVEAVGIVERCGEGGTKFRPGQRVAYGRGSPGAYAEYRAVPEDILLPLPGNLEDTIAASLLLKGLTAHYLLHRTFSLQSGQRALVHAAAGGVGLLLCQWAKHLGAQVIGTVGTEAKAELARAHGCDEVVFYTRENIAQRVREWTGGAGVDVVYDSVGKATFEASLDCLKPFGMMVSFGQSSGPVPPFDISLLQKKGSLYLTRPTLMHHAEDKVYYREAAQELFGLLANGALKATIDRILPLSRAAEAHRLLESRATSGAIVLAG